MKKIKIALLSSIILSNIVTTSVNAESITLDTKKEIDQNYDVIQPMVTIPNWVKTALKSVIINVAKRIPISDNPGTVYEYSNHALVYHKSVQFNTGGIGSAIEKNLNLYGRDVIKPYLQRNQLVPGVKGYINILWNGSLVSSKTVSSGEQLSYTVPGSEGTARNIKIHYGSTEKTHWYPRMDYIPYRDLGPILPSRIISLNDSSYVEEDNNIYIKNQVNSEVTLYRQPTSYTIEDLYMDFYNEKIEELSNQSKSLNVGEYAKIIDTITNLEYDKTIFHFKANSEHDISSHELHFAGNLTENYSVGDRISLSFEIMPLTEEYDFVDLDYNIMFSKTGVVPEINSFISNK